MIKSIFIFMISVLISYTFISITMKQSKPFSTSENKELFSHFLAPQLRKKELSTNPNISDPYYLSSLMEKGELVQQLVKITQYINSLSTEQLKKELLILRNASSIYNNENAQHTTLLLYEHWAKSEPEEAFTSFLTHEMSNYHNSFKKHLFSLWLQNDLDSALSFSKEKTNYFQDNFDTISRYFFTQDREKGIEWLIKETNKPFIYQFELNDIFEPLFQYLPFDQSTPYLSKMNDNKKLRKQFIKDLAAYGAKSDWETTQKWIKSLPLQDQKAATSSALLSLQNTHPEVTLKLANEDCYSELNPYGMLNMISKTDPEKAKNWILENYSKEDPTHLSAIIRNMESADPQGTLNFLKELPPSFEKDSAIYELIQYSPHLSIPQKLEFMHQDNQPTDLNSPSSLLLLQLLQKWDMKESHKVREWIDASPYSEKQKEFLREKAKSRIDFIDEIPYDKETLQPLNVEP